MILGVKMTVKEGMTDDLFLFQYNAPENWLLCFDSLTKGVDMIMPQGGGACLEAFLLSPLLRIKERRASSVFTLPQTCF